MEHAARGMNYSEIAELEGYSNESGARQAVARGFERAFDRAADELRPIYQARAEFLYRTGVTLMAEGLDVRETTEDGEPVGPDLDRVRAGAQIADRALGRLMVLSNLNHAQVTVSAGSGQLAALKAEFDRALNGDGVVDGEVVTEEDGE